MLRMSFLRSTRVCEYQCTRFTPTHLHIIHACVVWWCLSAECMHLICIPRTVHTSVHHSSIVEYAYIQQQRYTAVGKKGDPTSRSSWWCFLRPAPNRYDCVCTRTGMSWINHPRYTAAALHSRFMMGKAKTKTYFRTGYIHGVFLVHACILGTKGTVTALRQWTHMYQVGIIRSIYTGTAVPGTRTAAVRSVCVCLLYFVLICGALRNIWLPS